MTVSINRNGLDHCTYTWQSTYTPYCFVILSFATEVSQAIIALNSSGNGAGDWHLVIRSGGHGSDNQNSITNGVVIDLTHLNGTEYNPETKIASIGTGARRGELQEHKVGVTGGQQSPVGIGGLTLGGGVGWTTTRTGFACDNVFNYEVVLANGEIINANASYHSDLWRALKGGSSNF